MRRTPTRERLLTSATPRSFVPERLLYDALSAATGASPQAVLAVNAVVNVLLLGAAARFLLTSGSRGRSHAWRVTAGVVPVALLTRRLTSRRTDTHPRVRDVAAPHHLLLVDHVGDDARVGLLIRTATAGAPGADGQRRGLALVFGTAVWTNPLVVLWVALPVVAVLAVMAVRCWLPAVRAGRGPVRAGSVTSSARASCSSSGDRDGAASGRAGPGRCRVRHAELRAPCPADLRHASPTDSTPGRGRGGALVGAVGVDRGGVLHRGEAPAAPAQEMLRWSERVALLCGIFVLGHAVRYLQPVVFLPLASALLA